MTGPTLVFIKAWSLLTLRRDWRQGRWVVSPLQTATWLIAAGSLDLAACLFVSARPWYSAAIGWIPLTLAFCYLPHRFVAGWALLLTAQCLISMLLAIALVGLAAPVWLREGLLSAWMVYGLIAAVSAGLAYLRTPKTEMRSFE